MQPDAVPAARRRGRPVGSDSAETRSRILDAARQVINAARLPGRHLPGHRDRRRPEPPDAALLLRLARGRSTRRSSPRRGVFIAECIADGADARHAGRAAHGTDRGAARGRLPATGPRSHSWSARAWSRPRNPELRAYARQRPQRTPGEVARRRRTTRGELSADTAVDAVVDMLHAMLWGVGFYAGFVDRRRGHDADAPGNWTACCRTGCWPAAQIRPTPGDTCARHAERRRRAAIDWRPYEQLVRAPAQSHRILDARRCREGQAHVRRGAAAGDARDRA